MRNFIRTTFLLLLAVAASAAAGGLLAPIFLDTWEADDCWRLDRQNDAGYPVAVPDWCEPHGFTPRGPGGE